MSFIGKLFGSKLGNVSEDDADHLDKDENAELDNGDLVSIGFGAVAGDG